MQLLSTSAQQVRVLQFWKGHLGIGKPAARRASSRCRSSSTSAHAALNASAAASHAPSGSCKTGGL